VTLFYNTTEIGKQYIYWWQDTSPKKKTKFGGFFLKKMEFLPKKINVTFCQNFAQKKDQLGVKLDGTNAMENYCWGKIIVA
jgi:hypothetical protein